LATEGAPRKDYVVELEKTWLELLDAANHQAGRPVGMWSGGLILATISLRGKPQLVVQIGKEEDVAKPAPIEAAGFTLEYENLIVGQGPYVCAVLESKSDEDSEMFYAVCQHLVQELSNGAADLATNFAVETIIRDWLAYWRTLGNGFSPSAFIGLVGELLAIDRWLDRDNFKSEYWQGPLAGPHDFCGHRFDIEVKATSNRVGPLTHEITSIDQLEERENRKLKLLSFRLGFSVTGSSSVHQLVERVGALLTFQDEPGKTILSKALADAGYSKDLPAKYENFDVWSESLFDVEAGFPRLTRNTIPDDNRILNLKYSIDLSGCDAFKSSEVTRNLRLGE
jgi:hypothetical protein